MKPHRPIDLDLFNEEFFSKKEGGNNSGTSENPVFTSVPKEAPPVRSDEKPKLHPSLTADVIEGLMKLQLSQESPVFHNLPDEERAVSPDVKEQPPVQPVAPSKRTPQISEEEALKSFPNFDFDPKVFDTSEDEAAPEIIPVRGNDALPGEEEFPNSEAENDRNKAKRQKKLEKKIQRPFLAKRLFSLLMVLFILVGIAVSGFAAILYKTGNTPESSFDIGGYSICYVDGENIKSSIIKNGIVVLKQERITGKRTILYRHNESTRLEKIVGVGEESYGIRYEGNPMQVINLGEIKGAAVFTLENIKPVYEIAHYQPTAALAAIAIYFMTVIIFFSVLISLRNKKIKKYRESYQIVS